MQRHFETKLMARASRLSLLFAVALTWPAVALASPPAQNQPAPARVATADTHQAEPPAPWWRRPIMPYFPRYVHSYKVFGLIPIQPFGVLVGIALVVGYTLGRRRARLTGLDPQLCADGMVWTVVSGFVVAHLFSVIFYFPQRLLERPWALLEVWAGLSSFGGFIGAIIGANLFFRKHKAPVMKYVDAIVFGFVPAWIIGRMGCTMVHDHPGRMTDFFLAVNAPGGPEHDLGLYEMLFAICLTAIIYALKKVRPFDGFHPALMLLLYSPVRFLFDYLRREDEKYLGLTPGQYAAIGMVALAVWLIIHGLRLRRQEQQQQAQPRPRRGLKTA